MTTIMPETELRKKAISYISDKLASGLKLSAIIDDASLRFNLGPKDSEFLIRFFKDRQNQG